MTNTESSLQVLPKRFKFAKGMAWLLLGLSLLVLVYTFYRSEIVYEGKLRYMYFFFYLLSFIGLLFWGVVLRLNDEIRLNLVISSISLVVAIYLAEIYLSFINSVSSNQLAAKKQGVFFDSRSTFEVIQDLKEEGTNAVPACLSKAISTPLTPLSGMPEKTSVGENENGKYMIYQSDRYGFNNPDSVWDLERTEWALVGDSYTLGEAVQPGEDIPSQIRSLINSSVINLGCNANGPLSQLAGLKEYAEVKAPKRVLWMYYEGNDFLDLMFEKGFPHLMAYLKPGFSQDLIHRQEEINSNLVKLILKKELKRKEEAEEGKAMAQHRRQDVNKWMLWRLFHVRNLFGLHPANFHENNLHYDIDPLFVDILTKARDRVAAWGGKFYFVYLPEYNRYVQFFTNHDEHRKRNELLNVVRTLDIPVVDIHHEVFAKHSDPLSLFPFRMGGHYTAEGYGLVAKAIVEGIPSGE